MNIFVFGNTNNYPLRLAQALQELGHDTTLVVDRREPLHRPESLVPEYANGYPDWIIDFSHLSEEDYVGPSPRITQVVSLLEGADALILNSLGPSLLSFVEKPAISFLTGSDLSYYANFDTIGNRAANYDPAFRRSAAARLDARLWAGFIQRQREGILRSTAVSYFHRGMVPKDDALLDGIGVSDEQRMFIYMCRELSYEPRHTNKNERPVLFCGTRLTWKKPIPPGASPLDYKGSDVMIHGVALFREKTGMDFDMRIFEKGLHVQEARALAHELGLDDCITWLPEMPAHDFYRELESADICFEQLGESCIGMVGLDAMAMGKPVIANAHPEIWRRHLGCEWPICHATTPEEVCSHLESLVPNPRMRSKIGKESSTFVQKHFSPRANARQCLERLKRGPS